MRPTGQEFFDLLLIGIFGVLGQICLAYAYRLADASEVSIYSNTNILFAAILGRMFFGEHIAPNTLVGGGMVLAAMILVYVFGRREKEAARRAAKQAGKTAA